MRKREEAIKQRWYADSDEAVLVLAASSFCFGRLLTAQEAQEFDEAPTTLDGHTTHRPDNNDEKDDTNDDDSSDDESSSHALFLAALSGTDEI